MSGFVGIVASLNFIMFIPVMFVNFYLHADLDSYHGRLNFTGLVNGVSLAILIWTLFFTWVHENEEGILNQALIRGVFQTMVQNSGDLGISNDGDLNLNLNLHPNEEF